MTIIEKNTEKDRFGCLFLYGFFIKCYTNEKLFSDKS